MKKYEQRQKKRQTILEKFNPDTNGLDHHGIFGLPFETDESELVIIPVPWDLTASYRYGASNGPEAILKASQQIDLFREEFGEIWREGIAMDNIPVKWKESCIELRKLKKKLHKIKSKKIKTDSRNDIINDLKRINFSGRLLNEFVFNKSTALLKENRLVGVVGGDHSVSYGLISALAKQYESFGILQIDAHADLRDSYEGFEFSHASAMFNALKINQVSRLVQVGIRDYSSSEYKLMQTSPERLFTFTDKYIKNSIFKGKSWHSIVEKITGFLPEKVYLSFDIDGLQPSYCPNTGTPVPGGLLFEEVAYLIEHVRISGRKIIGFDLCETAPNPLIPEDEWDGNVGARVLYELSCNALLTKETA